MPEPSSVDQTPKHYTLGTVRLRQQHTNEIILVPQPSEDPNDPLNWPKAYRWYITTLACLAIFLCQFLAAGPSVAIVDMIIDVFGTPPRSPGFSASLAKASYFFTGVAFIQGMVNLFWMPIILKYGRRPVYIISFVIFGGASLWCSLAKGYTSELCARLLLGFAGGSAESLVPLTITDIFFLHERGLMMAFYSATVAGGVGCGIVLCGLITIGRSWRVIYYVTTALIGTLVITIFFTMPETAYKRTSSPLVQGEDPTRSEAEKERVTTLEDTTVSQVRPPRKTYTQQIKLFNGTLTQESFTALVWRPVILILLPPVLWSTLALSVMVSASVTLSSNFAAAFTTTYNWTSWQSGLTWIANVIGALLGVGTGGWLSDKVADSLTKKNGGIREAEMRLPIITLSMVSAPLSMLLYGFGIDRQLHWMIPVLGIGILGFTVTQGVNSVILYAVDAYRPIAGEVVVAMLALKAAFAFLLSFYMNSWIERSGHAITFGALAGIQVAILIVWIPLYIWGKKIRHITLQWRIVKGTRWADDREVGE